jgi:hypothetical protein
LKRIIRKSSLIASFLIFILGLVPTTNAVWNGYDEPNNQRAVPILMGVLGDYCNGSGFLYSPRIVFTVAHGIYRGDDRKSEPTDKFEKLWVGYPGQKVTMNSKRIESVKILIPDNYKARTFWLGGKRMNRENDFAIIVLKEPLPTDDKPVELLTPELHDQYIANREEISLKGYGANDVNSLNKTCDLITPKSMVSRISSKIESEPGLEWTARLNFRVGVQQPNICDGDSGAGYVKLLPNKYIYLGAQSSSINNHNCMSHEPASQKESLNGTDPVYLYADLVKQAEDYVKANPYVAPVVKKTITCKKGKRVKFVEAENPKCPKGYKQK